LGVKTAEAGTIGAVVPSTFSFVLLEKEEQLKNRLGDQRGGSEWEPIKIRLRSENLAYTPNLQPRIPTRVWQGNVVTTDLPTLGTNPKRFQSESTNVENMASHAISSEFDFGDS
jgi:hypothetical protein